MEENRIVYVGLGTYREWKKIELSVEIGAGTGKERK
jgi:hypothetical protein